MTVVREQRAGQRAALLAHSDSLVVLVVRALRHSREQKKQVVQQQCGVQRAHYEEKQRADLSTASVDRTCDSA